MDKLLQRSLAFIMKARHFPIAIESGLFGDRIIVQMMIRFIDSYQSSEKDMVFLIIFLTHLLIYLQLYIIFYLFLR